MPSRFDILVQFLTESISISAVGSAIGVVVGVVGVAFGTYPARRAARLEPVEAIRYE